MQETVFRHGFLKVQTLFRQLAMASAFFSIGFGGAALGFAQTIDDVQDPTSPLILENRGSFFIGGESVEQSEDQVAFGGHVTINQMYVDFMEPADATGVPVVMLHGATLTGKTYDTTPDGRMGWYEYFVRSGHPVYVPDQISRGRSGFNSAIYNDVRAGNVQPEEQPQIGRLTDEVNWTNFRFGSAVDTPWPDSQFPIEAISQLSTQAVPQFTAPPVLEEPNPNYRALSNLARRARGAVLMGHSQSGAFPLEAALVNSEGIRGMILVEPGGCNFTPWTEEEIATFSEIPILVIFGDYIGDVPTGIPGFDWQVSFDGCETFIDTVNASGGNAEMLDLPAIGINGNSHMLMQDKNNIEVADLILNWIDDNVQNRGTAGR